MNAKTEDTKQIIVKTLEIIGYQKDKNNYADGFMELCEQQILINLLQSLSEHRQKQFQIDLDGKLDKPKRFRKLLKEYFSEKDILDASEKVAERTFKDFLQAIIPTLKREQKEKLQQYLKSLKTS